MNNLPAMFEFSIDLIDQRNEVAENSEERALRYRVHLISGNKHCVIWSEPLKDEEVGTIRSFHNVMDQLRYKIIEKICPDEIRAYEEKRKQLTNDNGQTTETSKETDEANEGRI